MSRLFIGVCCCFLGSAAIAQTTKAKCDAIGAPMNQTSRAMSKMYVAMKGLDFTKIANEFSGDERAQFLKMGQMQSKLLPVFGDYLFELETLGLMMSRCAR